MYQTALFLSVGVACAAVAATLLIGWLTARAERFLLTWSTGGLILGLGSAMFMASSMITSGWFQAAGYTVDVIGFAVLYAAAIQFRTGRIPWSSGIVLAGIGALLIGIPFLMGLDGLGTVMMNLVSAAFLSLTAAQYWRGRAEAPISLVSISILYLLVGASFLLCAALLLRTSPLVLEHAPQNWAENVNAITSLIGIVGVGAMSLALNQTRMARRHRLEADTDSLTGLLNRRALFDRFGVRTLAAATAIVVFDLDRFKAVNDRFGHAVGDEVLGRFAAALRATMRPGDCAARVGGEEFVLMMRGATPELAVLAAEHIRAQFEAERITTEDGPFATTVSAGVAFSETGGESFETVLKRADMALYQAKTGGRNRVAPAVFRLVA